jgi:parallel beta-helix repeat protein
VLFCANPHKPELLMKCTFIQSLTRLLFFITPVTLSWGQTTIYVSPTGNDAHAGSKEQPLATLIGARNKARLIRKQLTTTSPIEVLVEQGNYYLTHPLELTVEDNGTAQAPLVFKAVLGAKPVFYGGKELGKFEKGDDGLWKMDIPESANYGWRFEQLYINGKRASRAKAINNLDFYHPTAVKETVFVKDPGHENDFATLKISLPSESLRWMNQLTRSEMEDVVITLYHKWNITRKHISSFNPKDSSIYVTGFTQKPWNTIDTHTTFNIENCKKALDSPGEWFLDRKGTLYYKPLPGETIENTTVIAPIAKQLVVISGNEQSGDRVAHVRFDGLTFKVTDYQMPLQGEEPAQGAYHIEAAVAVDYADNISFSDCEIAHTGGTGIWFRKACSNSKVERNYLHDIGASGVKIGDYDLPKNSDDITHHIVVDNNIMHSGGMVFPCAVAIMIFHASDNELTHNDIGDFQYSGISVGWVWGYDHSPAKRNKIAYNHIHHLGWGVLSDMGGIYTLGISEGTVVANNVIHHVYSFDYGGWGLYTDEGSTDIIMEKNLVYNCKSSGFHQHYGKDNIIRNNLFINNIKGQLQATREEKHRSFSFTNNIVYFNQGSLLTSNWEKINLFTDKNAYWDTRTTDLRFKKQSFKEWQASGKDVSSVIANPEFSNEAQFDFRIGNKKLLKRIGFTPIDYTQAGVYGTEEWKVKAKLDPKLEKEFEAVVAKHESKK